MMGSGLVENMCPGFVQCWVARVLQMGFENFCSVDVDLFAVEKSLDVGQVHVDGIVGWHSCSGGVLGLGGGIGGLLVAPGVG